MDLDGSTVRRHTLGERSPHSLGAAVAVSLKDVAVRSNVSFQTASKVLNGHAGIVSAATRERIEVVARELGYVPNALARGLVRQASFVVGVLAEDPADPALAQFVVAAQHA